MRVPHPDAVLVEAADRAALPLQAAGVPLPAVLRAAMLFTLASFVGGVVNFCLLGEPLLALVWGVAALGNGPGMWGQQARYGADAARWSTDLAASYRARALAAREAGTATRLAMVLAISAYCAMMVFLNRSGSYLARSEYWPIVASLCGIVAHSYLACAMPRDPDAPSRSAPAA